MTTAAWVLLAGVTGAAVLDWVAVVARNRPLEYQAKPATLILLVALALTLDPVHSTPRAWVVAALVLSLVGDVLLMLPDERFVAGLAAFLAAHVAYILALLMEHRSWAFVVVGLVVVSATMAIIGPRILTGVRVGSPALMAPVLGYMVVISAMVVSAWGTAVSLAIAGALLFYASDATLAWNRFVRPLRHGRLGVMVTYHLGQTALVLSLVR